MKKGLQNVRRNMRVPWEEAAAVDVDGDVMAPAKSHFRRIWIQILCFESIGFGCRFVTQLQLVQF